MPKVLFVSFFSLVFLFVFSTKNVYGLTCSHSMSPSVVAYDTTTNIDYQITNNGPEPIDTVLIEIGDASVFRITGGSTSGWNLNFSDGSITYSGGTINSGQSVSFNFSVYAIAESSGPVSVDLTVSSNGVPYSCEGAYNLEIGDVLTLSNLVVSASQNSATVSWNTSDPASSTVSYGTTNAYGTNAGSADLVTTRAVVLSGLSASTTYYYKVCSTNGSGQQSCFGQNTFTTGAVGTSTTVTTTATVTTSTSTTTSAVATPVPLERIPPRVTLDTDFKKPFEVSPDIIGKATDNKGVISVEYSIDGGINWLPVDSVEGIGVKVEFLFTPLISEDGNYEVIVRARDAVGNIGTSKAQTLIIDRLPPRVGGNLISLGPHPLLPNKNGVIITLTGLKQIITLSTVGGATSVDIKTGELTFSMSPSSQSGLWQGTITFPKPGLYQLTAKSKDGAGNETERDINKVLVLKSGKITSTNSDQKITGGEITLYIKDEAANLWNEWDGKTFGQNNPVFISENGSYELFLPPGVYYAKIKANKYSTFYSKIFNVDSPMTLNSNIVLPKLNTINIGPLKINLPNFFQKPIAIPINIIEGPEAKSLTLGSTIKTSVFPSNSGQFSLTELIGKPSVLTFVSSWSPQSLEQIPILDELIYSREVSGAIVNSQEGLAKTTIFAKRGGYLSEIVVDKDGDLVKDYNVTTLPTHLFLDKNGIVRDQVVGVLNSSELKERIENVSN